MGRLSQEVCFFNGLLLFVLASLMGFSFVLCCGVAV
jgi:hypothetical protein